MFSRCASCGLAVGLLSAVGMCLATTSAPAGAQDKAKASIRWEYCLIAERVSGGQVELFFGKDTVGCKSWKELATHLKAALPEQPSQPAAKVAVFNGLGAQGWELVNSTQVTTDSGVVFVHYAFKRPLEGK